jgi:hypothetical protein
VGKAKLSGGFFAVTLALHLCGKVDVYGRGAARWVESSLTHKLETAWSQPLSLPLDPS